MARRVDRLAQWIAADLLKAQKVARSPDSMARVMPVAYTMAAGFMGALGSVIADTTDELLRGSGRPVRHPAPGIREMLTAMDMRYWETQLAEPAETEECDPAR